jgi:hypothetical protein
MTTRELTLNTETEKDLLRRCWMWHDARWFAAVAGEFGIEAANRINKKNVRALGQTEMRCLMKALAVDRVDDLTEAMELYDAGRDLYVPPSLMDAEVGVVTPDSYEVTFRRCFVRENIVRAGIADTYECAVFDRIQGWHDAWGLLLVEDLPVRTCALAAGQQCRQRFAVRQERRDA